MICSKRNLYSILPLALAALMSGCRSATPAASPTLAADDPESVAAVTDMPPTSESSDASEALAPPPEGLRFQTDEGTWRVGPSGQLEQLTESGILLSPWGDAGIPVAPEATNLQLPMLDLGSGESKLIDLPGRLVSCFDWLDGSRVLCGLRAESEDDGPNLGHLSLIDIRSEAVSQLDPDHWMISPPAASPDGTLVAFERTGEPQLWREDETIAFPTMAFQGAEAGDARMTSPAFSPDGRKIAWLGTGEQISVLVFDLVARRLDRYMPYAPVGFGGWFPAPIWSPDSRRLIVDVLADSADDRGLFLLDTRSGESTHIGEALGQATWVDNERFVVSTSTMGDPSQALIYEIGRRDLVVLDLPEDARLAGFDRDRLPAAEDAAEPADLEWLFDEGPAQAP
jgi:hypothetical protein